MLDNDHSVKSFSLDIPLTHTALTVRVRNGGSKTDIW